MNFRASCDENREIKIRREWHIQRRLKLSLVEQMLVQIISQSQMEHRFKAANRYLCFIGEHLWLNRKRFHRRFQACHIRDVEQLHLFINALHEAAQGRAGAEFDELRETLRQQITHGFFPEH